MLGVKWNSLGHAASLRCSQTGPLHRSSFSKSSVDNNPRDAQSTGLSGFNMPPRLGEMTSETCDTLFPTKVLNWHGLPTSQSNTQSKQISNQEEHQAINMVDRLHKLRTNLTWVWSTSLPVPPWFLGFWFWLVTREV